MCIICNVPQRIGEIFDCYDDAYNIYPVLICDDCICACHERPETHILFTKYERNLDDDIIYYSYPKKVLFDVNKLLEDKENYLVL